MHAMGLYMLGDGVYKVMNKHHAQFFWEAKGPKHMYQMVWWDAMCRPKSMGALEITDTKLTNIGLMVK
jgi:hypothetical protein